MRVWGKGMFCSQVERARDGDLGLSILNHFESKQMHIQKYDRHSWYRVLHRASQVVQRPPGRRVQLAVDIHVPMPGPSAGNRELLRMCYPSKSSSRVGSNCVAPDGSPVLGKCSWPGLVHLCRPPAGSSGQGPDRPSLPAFLLSRSLLSYPQSTGPGCVKCLNYKKYIAVRTCLC